MDESLYRNHVAYMIWADRMILDAVAALESSAAAQPTFPTLRHMYLAEVVWIERIQGNGSAQLADLSAPSDLASLAADWATLHSRWETWVDSFRNWDQTFPHFNSQGSRFEEPYSHVLLHVVNHSTLHRGQVMAMIRAAGIAPPNTDLITYYRSLKQPKQQPSAY